MSENKSSSKSSIIIIVILCLILIGLTGYIVYDKVLRSNTNKTNNTSNENNKIESLDINSDFVKELYEKTAYSTSDDVLRSEYLKKDKVLVSELSEEIRMIIAFNHLEEDLVTKNHATNNDLNAITEYFKEEDLISKFNYVFGKNAVYNSVNKFMPCLEYKYDESKKIYYSNDRGCGGISEFSLVEDIISANKYSDRVEIVTVVAYAKMIWEVEFEGIKYYADLDEKNLIEKTDNFDYKFSALKHKDKLNQYKYTFTLDNSDGNYYFYSVEKIK